MDSFTESIKEIEKLPSFENKPHCFGKMTWILKYPDGEEPSHSVCRCEFGSGKCKLLTRERLMQIEGEL